MNTQGNGGETPTATVEEPPPVEVQEEIHVSQLEEDMATSGVEAPASDGVVGNQRAWYTLNPIGIQVACIVGLPMHRMELLPTAVSRWPR